MEFETEETADTPTQATQDWESLRAAMIAAEKAEAEAEYGPSNPGDFDPVQQKMNIKRAELDKLTGLAAQIGATDADLMKLTAEDIKFISYDIDKVWATTMLQHYLYKRTNDARFLPTSVKKSLENAATTVTEPLDADAPIPIQTWKTRCDALIANVKTRAEAKHGTSNPTEFDPVQQMMNTKRTTLNKITACAAKVGITEDDLMKLTPSDVDMLCSDVYAYKGDDLLYYKLQHCLYNRTNDPRFLPKTFKKALENAATATTTEPLDIPLGVSKELLNIVAAAEKVPVSQILAEGKRLGDSTPAVARRGASPSSGRRPSSMDIVAHAYKMPGYDPSVNMTPEATQKAFDDAQCGRNTVMRSILHLKTGNPIFSAANYRKQSQTHRALYKSVRIPFRPAIMSPLKSKPALAAAATAAATAKYQPIPTHRLSSNSGVGGASHSHHMTPVVTGGRVSLSSGNANTREVAQRSGSACTHVANKPTSGVQIIMQNKAKAAEFDKKYGQQVQSNILLSSIFNTTPAPTAPSVPTKVADPVAAAAQLTGSFKIVIEDCEKRAIASQTAPQPITFLTYEYDTDKYYPVAGITDADLDIIKSWYSRCGIAFTATKTDTLVDLNAADLKTMPKIAAILSGKRGLTKTQIPLFMASLPEYIRAHRETEKYTDVDKIIEGDTPAAKWHYTTSTAPVTDTFRPSKVSQIIATAEKNMAKKLVTIDDTNDTVFYSMYDIDCENRAKRTATFLKTLKSYNQAAYEKLHAAFDDLRDIDIELYAVGTKEYTLVIAPAVTYCMGKLREICAQIAKYDAAILSRHSLDGLLTNTCVYAEDSDGIVTNTCVYAKDATPWLVDERRKTTAWNMPHMPPEFYKIEPMDGSPSPWNMSSIAPDTTREKETPLPWCFVSSSDIAGSGAAHVSADNTLDATVRELFEDKYVDIAETSKNATLLRKSSDSPKTHIAKLRDNGDSATTPKPTLFVPMYRDIDCPTFNYGESIPAMGEFKEQLDEICKREDETCKRRDYPEAIGYKFKSAAAAIFDGMAEDDDTSPLFKSTLGAPYPTVYDNLTQTNYPTLYDQLINNPQLTNAYPHLATPHTHVFNEKMAMETAQKTYIAVVLINQATLSTVVETVELATGNLKELVDIQKAGGLSRFAHPEYGFEKLFFYRTTDKTIIDDICTRFNGVAHFALADINHEMDKVLHLIDIQIHRAEMAADAAVSAPVATNCIAIAGAADSIEKLRAMIRNYVATAFDKNAICAALKSMLKDPSIRNCRPNLGLYHENYTVSDACDSVTIGADDILADYLRSSGVALPKPKNYLIVKKELVDAFVVAGWTYNADTKTLTRAFSADEVAAVYSSHVSPKIMDFAYNPLLPIITFDGAYTILRDSPAASDKSSCRVFA